MPRTRSRVLTVGTATLAALALAIPAAAPAFAEPGAPGMVVSSASPSYAHGTTGVSYTITIENAPPACLAPGYPFELHYEFDGETPSGDVEDEGVFNGGHTVSGTSLVFTYLIGTVSGPATYFLYAYTDDACLGGPSFGESAWISVEPSTAGTLVSGTVFEQQVAGSTDPDDYVRREGVRVALREPGTYNEVTAATTGPDGSYLLLAPFNDTYDENSQYILTADLVSEWDYSYHYAAGSGAASPSPIDGDDATVFTADEATSYDFYVGRLPGVDPTHSEYICFNGTDGVSQDVVTDLVEWEYVCGTDGSIIDAELTFTGSAFDGFGYVAFPSSLGRVPDAGDINTDYFATIDDADDVSFTTTATGAVVGFRDEDAKVRNDAGDLVNVDVEVELVIDGQWARWTVNVYDAGSAELADDVTFYFVGALGSQGDTVWLGDDDALVSWDGGADERPIVGHRALGGEAWHLANHSGDVSLRGHESLEYEVVLIDVCPTGVDLATARASVVGAAFGDAVARQGSDCPALPEWAFPTPSLMVGVAYDETFTAPSTAPWDWSEGGEIYLTNDVELPHGLDWEPIDVWQNGVAPKVRIFGTPTTSGPYEFSLVLHDDFDHIVGVEVEGAVDDFAFTGDDTIHGVVHVQTVRGEFDADDYELREGVKVALVALDYGTWWDEDYTDANGAFTLTAEVGNGDDAARRYVILVEIDDRWYYYQDGAAFGDPSTLDIDDATWLRPTDFDGDASYDVYAGRALGISDTVASRICDWNGSLSQDVRTATAYWSYLCLTDGSIDDAETDHLDDAFDTFGNVVFPSRLDRVPDSESSRFDYFVSADEHTVTDTATGTVVTIIDRDIDVLDESDALVKVDAEITVEISGSWARWEVEVYRAGTRVAADDVRFYFVGNFGSDDDTTWLRSGARAVSWDGGDEDPLLGHRVSNDDDWSYADGTDEMSVLAYGDLTYEVALVDWCDGGAADPMVELLTSLGGAAFGSTLAQLGGVCDPQATWDVPTPSFTVGVPFDQTFTAPSDGLWDWTDGGAVDAYDLPAGLVAERLDIDEDGVAPSLRIHGTPTAAGTYRIALDLRDNAGHSWWGYVPGKVAPAVLGGEDDDEPSELDLGLDLDIGDLVEGGQATVTASGLQDGAGYDIIVRSTPQTLGVGTVPTGGILARTVTLPALSTGWHSLTFTSTWANGSSAVARVWFQVGADGRLLAVSSTAPNLATTGAGITGSLTLAAVTLLAGVGLVALRRRRGATV